MSVPVSANEVEVRCWAVEPSTGRDDICFPLSEWGTGVGQVIAILYVTMTHETPSCIVIDEPNSFLHPGAVKKLIDVLKLYPHHQYIISTHSAEVIKAANPEQVIRLTPTEDELKISLVPVTKLDTMREIFADLGISLGDVFGADTILWVEGKSEEECFPMIIRDLLKMPTLGVSIRSVSSASELTEQRPRLIRRFLELYRKVSEGPSLVPTAIGFSFDPVKISSKEKTDLEKLYDGKLRFLPRLNLESYLLHPEAIAWLLNGTETFKDGPAMTGADISKWMSEKGGQKKYHPMADAPTTYGSDAWFRSVDGALLLNDMLQEVSGAKEIYRKIPYSARLTKWLIDNDFKFFDELKGYVESLIKDLPKA